MKQSVNVTIMDIGISGNKLISVKYSVSELGINSIITVDPDNLSEEMITLAIEADLEGLRPLILRMRELKKQYEGTKVEIEWEESKPT